MVLKRLRKVLQGFVEKVERVVQKAAEKATTKTISEKDVDEFLQDLLMELIESDVAFETAEKLVEELRKRLVGLQVPRGADTRKILEGKVHEALVELLKTGWRHIDLVSEAKEKCRRGEPLVIVFLGVNGVGKTTTIAKFAYMFKKAGLTPVIAAADTFRAGAQEQLRLHAERVGAVFVGGRYGADPASVAYDAIQMAKSRGYCVVLVDTAGRMHTDIDLMEELRKIVRVAKPDYKVLVVDALTGNDAVEQAKFFDEAVGVDFVVLTKFDADAKGGTAISVVDAIKKPILFLGVGQRYEDLEPMEPEKLVAKLLS
ncbi:signal recognition particle-docking protein FtsY [Pyrolobus fumarii 1A]|uniref:Signal recognition particle receptor FtsY n=1 Tax=Pyrolobus fumarii (strain DSM 11204 / 1A) TaxID=694429 RepID=G0EEN1_PYRF1|nr:signal recognition particle-docking protein FtsY [Pyrolobus fumarii]AEM38853.1 signal recognition particle-docking protein FtsY [Pyrolobus fumarii 1A]